MTRVKRGNVRRKKHKKVLKEAKGFRGSLGTLYRAARQAVTKAGVYAYQGRKLKKRNYRSLWIARINAALKLRDFSYNRFIKRLKEKNILLDRKMLAYLADTDEKAFDKVLLAVKD